jgi:hypothetical protein
MNKGNHFAKVFVLLWVAAILILTTRPAAGPERGVHLCLFCGRRGGADAIRNFLFFVPLGVTAVRVWRPSVPLFAAAVLFPVCLETAQLFIPGRISGPSDAIFNSAGTLVGMSLGLRPAAWLWPRTRPSWVVSVASVFGALAVFVLTGLAVTPSLPSSAYSAEWAPPKPEFYHYAGDVLAASVGPRPLPAGPIAESAAVRTLLRQGAPVRVRVRAGPSPPGLAPIVSIYDDQQREILILGADRSDLVFRLRLRAQAWALEDTDVRWVGGLTGVAERDTIQLEAWTEDGGTCLSVNRVSKCGLGYTLGDGWRIIRSNGLWPEWVDRGLTILWLLGLSFIVGWWSMGPRHALRAGVCLTVALFLVPAVTALLPTPLPLFAAAGVGFAGGVGASRIGERLTWQARSISRDHPP